MSKETRKIKCPQCDHEIDINEILYHQLDEELRKKYNEDLSREKDKLKDQKQELEKEKENIQNQIEAIVIEEKAKLEIQLKKKIEEEHNDIIRQMKQELGEQSEKVKELNKSMIEIERLKREKEELRGTIELESERKLNLMISQEKEKIQKQEESKAFMRVSEMEIIVNQLRNDLQEAQRRAEQGSMQRQGEAQELVIEDWLRSRFPHDTIEEIKKGSLGADCIQIVNTREWQNCGSIYYESKRTKSFQASWIEKFKTDIRQKNADIGVLVTEAMPSDMDRMGLKDGIWICTFEEFKSLCFVLRESLVTIHTALLSQENKGEKMAMLYQFLTSNEFRLQIEAIVEGFTQMQTDLESEKRAMAGIWKKREKQIHKVLLNTNYMYSSIRGIAGNAIQAVPLLELDQQNTDNPDSDPDEETPDGESV